MVAPPCSHFITDRSYYGCASPKLPRKSKKSFSADVADDEPSELARERRRVVTRMINDRSMHHREHDAHENERRELIIVDIYRGFRATQRALEMRFELLFEA